VNVKKAFNPHIEPAYLDLPSLAAYCCLAVPTLRDYLKRGMPYYRLRGKVLVNRGEFDAWLSQFKVGGAPGEKPDDIADEILSKLA